MVCSPEVLLTEIVCWFGAAEPAALIYLYQVLCQVLNVLIFKGLVVFEVNWGSP